MIRRPTRTTPTDKLFPYTTFFLSKAGAPVNIIDQTELFDFQFGTIVDRSPLVLAISTDGGAPMLGQSIRARIESVLPLGLTGWAKAAREWRPKVKQRIKIGRAHV